MSPQDVLRQITAIQAVMKEAMTEGCHYGPIATDRDGNAIGRKVLKKPGAEKLLLMFRLSARFTIPRDALTELPGGHYRYDQVCTLYYEEKIMGEGIGSCTSLETKYRYRWADAPAESPQRAIRNRYGKIRAENPDIEDVRNTVAKMACKRALVHAVLNVTAASDIFDQDIDEDHILAAVADDGRERDVTPVPPTPEAVKEVLKTNTKKFMAERSRVAKAIMSACGGDAMQAKKLLMDFCGKPSIINLSSDDVSALANLLDSKSPEFAKSFYAQAPVPDEGIPNESPRNSIE